MSNSNYYTFCLFCFLFQCFLCEFCFILLAIRVLQNRLSSEKCFIKMGNIYHLPVSFEAMSNFENLKIKNQGLCWVSDNQKIIFILSCSLNHSCLNSWSHEGLFAGLISKHFLTQMNYWYVNLMRKICTDIFAQFRKAGRQ